MNVTELLPWIQVLIIPALAYIGAAMQGIHNQLRSMNSRTKGIETWIMGHDKQDDERHKDIQSAFAEVRKDADIRQARVHALSDELTTLLSRDYISRKGN